ncbi:anthranilate synthase component II [Pontibacillus salipaludis]|uniref:Aminodeoxychorismate/anthranilate synthase component II n=1 Tax=Pontibacillus salipaludis TaxID=1697394 RepID=A0ABQ1QCL9_9BACI|nr:aminodeoxychorismate/anthranilate synthase component II [Pontibacillus salipaludis]GGD22175.1 aminodeoxychorismate/anthranilate synthase component II [Pontibacillus salipaludis]
MIVMIDNYDSFTYNLFQYIQMGGYEVEVFRNDQITIEEIEELTPEAIVLSPGPGSPIEAGICLSIVRHFFNKIPILGICLGHQIIVEAFGGVVVKGNRPMHGKVTSIHHDRQGVYKALPSPTAVTRYHSLVAQSKSLPSELVVTSRSEDGAIMGVRHKKYPIEGIQFHPEAILTSLGYDMLQNFFAVKEVASS